MPKPLLQRQVSLLDYLTSSAAIFDKRDTPLDPALRDIDPALLRLEARFSHEKRMEKIAAVFPRTFELLGAAREQLIREFVQACPADDISRLKNACAFHAFLLRRWRDEPPTPPYLPDVAACELACARVCGSQANVPQTGSDAPTAGCIRRYPNVLLLRADYDVRSIFEQSAIAPQRRDTSLAIIAAAGQPNITELAPEVFDVLTALEEWTDPSVFDAVPQADELIAELRQAGLIEVSA
jgi:hypothetical protein